MNVGLNLSTAAATASATSASSVSPSLSPPPSSFGATNSAATAAAAAAAAVQAAAAAAIFLQHTSNKDDNHNYSSQRSDWYPHTDDSDDMQEEELLEDEADDGELSPAPPLLDMQQQLQKRSALPPCGDCRSGASPPPALHHALSQKPSYCTPNPVPNIPENNVVRSPACVFETIETIWAGRCQLFMLFRWSCWTTAMRKWLRSLWKDANSCAFRKHLSNSWSTWLAGCTQCTQNSSVSKLLLSCVTLSR